MADSVPKGGLNKGIIYPLKFRCPSQCVCESDEVRPWYHAKCGDPSFITQYGYILCKNHLNQCKGYFLKDASFQCSEARKNNTWNQHKDLSQLLMALSLAIQVGEINCKEKQDMNNLNEFTKSILEEIQKKWYC